MKKVKEISCPRDVWWVKRPSFRIPCSEILSYLPDSCTPNVMTLLCHAGMSEATPHLWYKGSQTSLYSDAEIQVVWPCSHLTHHCCSSQRNPQPLDFPTHLTRYIAIQRTYTENGRAVEVSWAPTQTGSSTWPPLNGDGCSSASPSTGGEIKQKEHSAMQTKSLTWDFPCWHFHHRPHHVTCPRSSINKNEQWEWSREGKFPGVANAKWS